MLRQTFWQKYNLNSSLMLCARRIRINTATTHHFCLRLKSRNAMIGSKNWVSKIDFPSFTGRSSWKSHVHWDAWWPCLFQVKQRHWQANVPEFACFAQGWSKKSRCCDDRGYLHCLKICRYSVSKQASKEVESLCLRSSRRVHLASKGSRIYQHNTRRWLEPWICAMIQSEGKQYLSTGTLYS